MAFDMSNIFFAFVDVSVYHVSFMDSLTLTHF